AIVLLGDVGQIEKLVERTGHRQQVLFRQSTQVINELLLSSLLAGTPPLGQATNRLDARHKARPQIIGNGTPEAIPQDAHIVAQRFVKVMTHSETPLYCRVNRW